MLLLVVFVATTGVAVVQGGERASEPLRDNNQSVVPALVSERGIA